LKGQEPSAQQRVIEQLFAFYLYELMTGDFSLFPPVYADILDVQVEKGDARSAMIRTIIDMIASMTEGHAINICHQMAGTSQRPAFQGN